MTAPPDSAVTPASVAPSLGETAATEASLGGESTPLLRLREQHFGQVSDLVLGAQIAALIAESEPSDLAHDGHDRVPASGCADGACAV